LFFFTGQVAPLKFKILKLKIFEVVVKIVSRVKGSVKKNKYNVYVNINTWIKIRSKCLFTKTV